MQISKETISIMKSFCARSTWVLAGLLFFAGMHLAAADDHAYVGSNRCRKCHIKEYRSWSKTKMAKAFNLLKPGERADKKKAAGLDPNKDYTNDEECIRCHVVGYDKKGGYVSPTKTKYHLGVGCEMCHGPGGTYIKDGYMTLKNKEFKRADLVKVGLVGKITAEVCTQCHNSDSPFVDEGATFDFETKVKEGIHEIYPLEYEH
jgi:hypothetical protein